jgi:hypothetical protein
VGGNFSGTVQDNYALNWVSIPVGAGSYNLTLNNTSSGGQLRASGVCDTGSGLAITRSPRSWGRVGAPR